MFTSKILSKLIKPTYIKPFLPLTPSISTFYTKKHVFSTYSPHHTLIPTTPNYNNNIPELAREWDENEGTLDKFNLSSIHDIKKLFSLLRKPENRYGLNDFVYFLRRIVQLNDERSLHISTHNSRDLSSFITQIKNSLRSATQEYPLIGSYAWCFWKLNHCNEDHELWLTLADHVIDGRFYPNFHETMCGIEGFTALDGFADQAFIDQVYDSLERALLVTIVEVNVTHYKRIAEGLLKVHRCSDEVFNSLEQHLLHFLSSHNSVQYDLPLILDILSAFSLSGNGSNNLFIYCQDIFNGFYDLSEAEQEEMSKGSFVSKLVQTYALAKYSHGDLVVDKDLRSLMSELILCADAKFTLDELVNLVQFCEVLELPKQELIDKRLNGMLFDVYGPMRCEDMVRYIDLKVHKDYNQEYKDLPKEILTFFDSYLCREMEKQKPDEIKMYITETEERGLLQENRGPLMDKVVEYVSKRLHDYDFEILCYFYWVFSKYRGLIHYEEGKVHCQMDMIKDNIRLQSAFAKGKLLPESNFYKMLEVVSGAEFLSEGDYPEW